MSVDTTPKKKEVRKPNRHQRRAEEARQRHFNAEIDRSDERWEKQQRADRIKARVQKKVEASRKRREARDAIKLEIAKKEGVSVSRIVLNGEGKQYTIRKSKKAELALKRQAEKKARREKYERRQAKK